MSSVSPKIASPRVRPSYYRLLWWPCGHRSVRFYFTGLHLSPGPHVRIGPPSGAGTCGTAAATNVPTRPTIRITVLTVRFMGSSPIRVRFPP